MLRTLRKRRRNHFFILHPMVVTTITLFCACSVETPPANLSDQSGEAITFIAMGDPQYGGGASDKNTYQINLKKETFPIPTKKIVLMILILNN